MGGSHVPATNLSYCVGWAAVNDHDDVRSFLLPLGSTERLDWQGLNEGDDGVDCIGDVN